MQNEQGEHENNRRKKTQAPSESTRKEDSVTISEEGKKLAEYIAQNYFDDPDAAKAFMDKINELANEYEKRDENTRLW